MARLRVSKQELLWREWLLGRERFRGDAKNPARRAETGAPPRIPDAWWERLEAFLARQSDHTEPGQKPTPAQTAPPKPIPAQLSANFHVREFACKDGRRVPTIALPALKKLVVEYVEPMRAAFGPGHVLSGYRPEDYNRRIGGATLSQHIYELTPGSVAADLTFRTGNPAKWAAFANQLGAGGVGRYDGSGFVHVDNRPDAARWTG